MLGGATTHRAATATASDKSDGGDGGDNGDDPSYHMACIIMKRQ